jgi:enediyne biosynthesis protein E4
VICRHLSRLLLIATAFLPPAGCGRGGAPVAAGVPAPTVRLVDVTEAAGIHFRHTSGASGRLYLPETMGAGCAFLDYDGDGWQDLFLVNSGPLPGYRGKGPFYPALYRNRGDGTFQEVTKEAGLAFECYGMGCAVGDYDNDGDEDLYITAWGSDHLFRNERVPAGKARFVDVTPPVMRARQATGIPHWGTSCAWVDYDRDGDLDLFVCRYARWRPEINRVCRDARGQPHACTPQYYAGDPPVLYRNDGHGGFSEVTRAAGLTRPRGKSLGIAVSDVDGDGWPDLLLSNDQEPNALYRNNRDGTFTDDGVMRGVAYSMDGKARAGMGIDTLDLAGDRAEAIVIGNRDGEGHAFFFPDGRGAYTDRAHEAGILEPGLSSLMFGALFRDYDLDGLPDLLTANGHVEPNVELLGGSVTFAQRPLVFHNESVAGAALPRFREVGGSLGGALATRRVWRGLAAADVDNDGDPDFLLSACNGPPMLLRNEGGDRNHWLKVRLEGVRSNREGLGSRVTVEAGGRRQTGWVRSGSSYCSSSELGVLFGLGGATQVERVVVRWASGGEEEVRGVAADQLLLLREGHGIARSGSGDPATR